MWLLLHVSIQVSLMPPITQQGLMMGRFTVVAFTAIVAVFGKFVAAVAYCCFFPVTVVVVVVLVLPVTGTPAATVDVAVIVNPVVVVVNRFIFPLKLNR